MRKPLSLLLLLPLTVYATSPVAAAIHQDAVKTVQPSVAATTTQALTNGDVSKMVEAKLTPEVVVEKIRTSRCDFDTTPEALRKLKDAGVPDAVLLVMVVMPNASEDAALAQPRKVSVKIPEGTHVELETAYTINSQFVRKDDAISFRVVNPVVVDGAVVIEKGATATALVTMAQRGGHFGRAGRIAWMMKEVTAADGSRVTLQFSGRTVGDSHGAKVATQMVVMGALLWPIAPIVLFHGFKRGENAVVPEGKRFDAVVLGTAMVNATAR